RLPVRPAAARTRWAPTPGHRRPRRPGRARPGASGRGVRRGSVAAAMAAAAVESLTITYGSVTAVDAPSFRTGAGQGTWGPAPHAGPPAAPPAGAGPARRFGSRRPPG